MGALALGVIIYVHNMMFNVQNIDITIKPLFLI